MFEDLDLDIYRGDFTAIMGLSGAGKSTLMYSLSGMDRPTGGSVRFAGKEITKCSDDELAVFRRKHCGFVFQQIYLLDRMSLTDNVLTAGALGGEKWKDVIARAKELFALVNIPERTQKKLPSQISGGEVKNNMELSFGFLMLFAAALIALQFVIGILLSRPIRKITAYSLIKE